MFIELAVKNNLSTINFQSLPLYVNEYFKRMICFPNAKINLGLFIVNKRVDGYHNLETYMIPAGPKDILEFAESDTDSFHLSGKIDPIPHEENIVLKARDLLRKKYGLPPLEIHLHKAIPAGAGLGGGSSDAAFFLKEANRHFNLGLNSSELRENAGYLGSDCPFFIDNKPAFAWSRGEMLELTTVVQKPYYLYLFIPEIHISTKDAYSQIIPSTPEKDIRKIIQSGISTWKKDLINDFESSIFKSHPVLGEIKEVLYSFGALYSSMSGSGSSMYGIFEEKTRISNDRIKEIDGKYAKRIWEGYIYL